MSDDSETGATLSALIDGEPIGAEALLKALHNPNSLELLRDFAGLRMRLQAEDDNTAPKADLVENIQRLTQKTYRPSWWHHGLKAVAKPLPRLVTTGGLLAAILLVVSQWLARTADPSRPPEPERTLSLRIVEQR